MEECKSKNAEIPKAIVLGVFGVRKVSTVWTNKILRQYFYFYNTGMPYTTFQHSFHQYGGISHKMQPIFIFIG